MTNNLNQQKELLAFYNASFGGNYELANYGGNLEGLLQNGYVSVTKCSKDPLSTHESISCKVPLARLTKAGIVEAQRIINEQYLSSKGTKREDIAAFIKSVRELPPRVSELYQFFFEIMAQLLCPKKRVWLEP